MHNQGRKNKQSGQAILEMALILPVFVAIGLGMADLEWCLERAGNLDYIVNEVARCEAIQGVACTLPNTPQGYANILASNLRMSTKDLKTVLPPGISCNEVTCTAAMSYQYSPIGVWFPAVTINRTGTASLPPAK